MISHRRDTLISEKSARVTPTSASVGGATPPCRAASAILVGTFSAPQWSGGPGSRGVPPPPQLASLVTQLRVLSGGVGRRGGAPLTNGLRWGKKVGQNVLNLGPGLRLGARSQRFRGTKGAGSCDPGSSSGGPPAATGVRPPPRSPESPELEGRRDARGQS